MNRQFSALLSSVRFGKFVSVGAVGAVFDLTVSTVLIVVFDVAPPVAKVGGAEVAIVVMFFINEHWTFADEGASGVVPTLRRLVKSNLVRSGGVAVQFLVVGAFGSLALSFPLFGVDLWDLVPLPIAIGVSMLLNYVLESLVTWRVAAEA
ncbi:GtrA family protein [Halomarina oriensis]|uniref:GtrA family protein n=1 Tax=Halomarina oriensis TaxID=671145 RepID=A0A6B0GIN2_9EURY|nr:GtrA family protein [Halomarina oriensis]MWG33319.1 GtrA family protein [Halomarina oriensis]